MQAFIYMQQDLMGAKRLCDLRQIKGHGVASQLRVFLQMSQRAHAVVLLIHPTVFVIPNPTRHTCCLT